MNSNFRSAALAATAVLAATLASGAQAAPASQSAQAKAKILKQISVTKTSDLNFGTIVVATTAGTVAIATDGSRTCDAALTCTGTVAAGGFNIAGSKSEAVTITSDASVSLTNADDATKTMTASLTRSSDGLTLSSTGAGSFKVGGTLAVAASQLDGLYSGTFNVTVNY